ncbi:MAG: hypothetical protein QXT39_05240 [Conexivisphaerales archaeon]
MTITEGICPATENLIQIRAVDELKSILYPFETGLVDEIEFE